MTIEYKPLNIFRQFQEAAQAHPEQAIIVDQLFDAFPELSLENTYESVFSAIEQRAFQMAQIGIEKGDKVILYKSPAIDTYFLAVAASRIGATPVMISYHLPAQHLDVFAQRLEKSFILFDHMTQDRVQQMTQTQLVTKVSINQLLEMPAQPCPINLQSQEVIQYMTHTSGTTGIPKLICHSAQTMGWRVAWQETIFQKMEAGSLLAFHISPVHSRYNIGISSAIELGFPLLAIATDQGDRVADLIQQYQAKAFETHPNNFVHWAQVAKKIPEKFASLRYFHSTFDAINLGTMATFLNASGHPDPVFMQVYGQSECGPMILRYHRRETLGQVSGRDMGIGLEGFTKVRITDEKGQEVAQGQNGHIQMFSRGRALTYYKEDERFAANVYGPWWDSGDYGAMTPEGTLLLKDRQVDLIDHIDSNLAIEDMLLDKLPFLAEVVIIRDVNGAPQPILATYPNQVMDWQAWWLVVADLPLLKEPILLEYDQIPRTATMKVQRLKMEADYKDQNL